MAGVAGAESPDMESSSSSSSSPASLSSSFQCCICLELLYKPIVLACGHISCFWCIYKSMHGLQPSYCAICRRQYTHFPRICQLLHLLLLKMEPKVYKHREKEVLEEEKLLDCFSPQIVHNIISEKIDAEKHNSVTIARTNLFSNNHGANIELTLHEHGLPEKDPRIDLYQQASVSSVLCAACNELLFHPLVLNCGHVYCEPCISSLVNGYLKCQVCQSLHPGVLPNICRELEIFLQEFFPEEYASRKEAVQLKISQCPHEDLPLSKSLEGGCGSKRDKKPELEPPTDFLATLDGFKIKTNDSFYKEESYLPLGNLETYENRVKSFCHSGDDTIEANNDLSNAHVAVGCDSCGAYPIIGKRYKCKDCKEKVSFDLCEVCYTNTTGSELSGRFNQQHKPDHRFELDDSRKVKLLMMRF